METDDGSTTNEDTDEPTVDVVSDATDNESQISGKVLIYKSRGELSILEPVCCKKQQKKFLNSYWFVK